MLPLLLLAQDAHAPDFGREVRPLLAERCFPCHGPDAESRAAGLRLDRQDDARAALAPGDLDSSEVWARVTSEFDFELMPPPESHGKPLDAEELDVLRRWIEAGAPWSEHWSFVPPTKAALDEDLTGHPIDALVQRVLDAEGIAAAPRAPQHTLIRRLSYDLRGLPPTAADRALAGTDAALEPWIDELLASEAHAERLAMWWLDAARYADTDGFQLDATRQNWPWRDWVVRAFHGNMPFDRFTELQFAGDLIAPDDPESVLATCFHRNHMHNGEGGRDPEESRVDYVRDRVNTMGAVWLGLTLDCAQCHDHKYDPLSQAEYYSLSAFFDSIDESGRAGGAAHPFLDYTSPLDGAALAAAREELDAARAWRAEKRRAARAPYERWRDGASALDGPRGFLPARPLAASSVEGHTFEIAADATVHRRDDPSAQEELELTLDSAGLERLGGIEVTFIPDETGRYADAEDGHFVLTGAKISVAGQHGRWRRAVADAEGQGVDSEIGKVAGTLDDDPRKGWTVREAGATGPVRARLELAEPLDVPAGAPVKLVLLFRSNVVGAYARSIRVALTPERGDASRTMGPTPREAFAAHRAASPDGDLPKELDDRLFAQHLEDEAGWSDAQRRVRGLERRMRDEERAQKPVKVTVLRERAEPRTTHTLERGVWDARGDAVARAVPASIGAPALETDAPTRLDLARWLLAPDHPLTARVLVNQVWQMLMGRGLVETPADLGTQCPPPVHAELLDWLAADLLESGWDLRRLIRLIVTSETYRRASDVDEATRARDPRNRLLARGARFRLPSWMIRDGALALGGLLDPTVGGPPVYPHQPPGVWEEMFMGRMRYEPTIGRARHRRSLYAFWRRNVAPSYFFDNADRRTCSVGRRLTNTPLHALTLLNDRTYAEAALALGAAAAAESESDDALLVDLAQRVLGRTLDADEAAAAGGVLERVRAHYREDPGAASAATASSPQGATPGALPEDPVRVAAAAALAAMFLNLDEAITRE